MAKEVEYIERVLGDIILDRQVYVSSSTAYNAKNDLHILCSKYRKLTNVDPAIDTVQQLLQLAQGGAWDQIKRARKDGRTEKAERQFSKLKEIFDGEDSAQKRSQEVDNTNQKKLQETDSSTSNIKVIETFLSDLRSSAYTPDDKRRLEARKAHECIMRLPKSKDMALQQIDLVLNNSNHWNGLESSRRIHQVDSAKEELEEFKLHLLSRENTSADVLKSKKEYIPSTNDFDVQHEDLTDKQPEREETREGVSSDENETQSVERLVETPPTEHDQKDRSKQRNDSDGSDSDTPVNPTQKESASFTDEFRDQTHPQTGRKQNLQKRSKSDEERELSKDEIIEQQAQKIRDLSGRLSQMAGDKLRYANPNIADLSDANRPIKLSEMFSELYDNEWSDAFEELTLVQKNEPTVIYNLLKVITKANQVCNSVTDEQIKKFKDTMTRPDLLPKNKATSCITNIDDLMTDEEVKLVKNILTSAGPCFKQAQKSSSLASIPVLKKMFKETMKTDVISLIFPSAKTEAFEKYATKCIELVWMMSTQEPPMHLEGCAVGGEAPSYFREYTSKGNIVGALVWPALFLHKDGPLMNKGVVAMKWNTV